MSSCATKLTLLLYNSLKINTQYVFLYVKLLYKNINQFKKNIRASYKNCMYNYLSKQNILFNEFFLNCIVASGKKI